MTSFSDCIYSCPRCGGVCTLHSPVNASLNEFVQSLIPNDFVLHKCVHSHQWLVGKGKTILLDNNATNINFIKEVKQKVDDIERFKPSIVGLNQLAISYHDALGNNVTNSVESNVTSVTITTPNFPASQIPGGVFYFDESATVDEIFEDEANNLKVRNAILKASSSEQKKSKVDDSFTKSEREIEFGDDE